MAHHKIFRTALNISSTINGDFMIISFYVFLTKLTMKMLLVVEAKCQKLNTS